MRQSKTEFVVAVISGERHVIEMAIQQVQQQFSVQLAEMMILSDSRTQEARVSDTIRQQFYESLPERLRTVARGIVACLSNRQIALENHIAASVVAARLTEIYERLQIFGAYDLDRRVSRLDVVRFFGDFFERHPEIN